MPVYGMWVIAQEQYDAPVIVEAGGME